MSNLAQYGDQTPEKMSLHDIAKCLFADMHVCGCMEFSDIVGVIRTSLENLNSEIGQRPEFHEALGVPHPIGDLILSMLDNADLCEHGGNHGFSWLTWKGCTLLNGLREHKDEDIETEMENFGGEPVG
ncbi:MAG: hypothetical protein ABFD89_11080 [Bryobacteraceae bacterium]